MRFFDRLFGRKKKNRDYMTDNGLPEKFSSSFRRERLHVHDKEERETYIRECLKQIADAEKEIHRLEYEYGVVTSQLADIEEIDRLSAMRQMEIQEAAKNLQDLEAKQTEYTEKKNRMTEKEFSDMERIEDEAEEGITKLKEAEEYQKLVKSDLKKLSSEKQAYEYRLDELKNALKNYKGAAVICFATMAVCFLILFILQMMLDLDTKLGYVLVVCLSALVLLKLFSRHNESDREIEQAEKDLNRLILLQNRVKIRYINNKNLLDYLCLKFHVKKAAELEKLWDRYQEEKRERELMEKASKDFVFYQKELLRLLRQSGIRDTSVWLHQTEAILEEEEKTKLRNSLSARRRVLRDQMDYNKELASAAQTEVTDLSRQYPQYKEEILRWISEYENA